jgi:ABC-type dipeptide/oligopeptide/nickel transport system permease component
MIFYVLKRLGMIVPVLLIASVVIFAVGRLAPGDPIQILLNERDATPQTIKETREFYGLDKPPIVQYFYWLKNSLQGDLGFSYFRSNRKVTKIIAEGFPVTAKLALLAILFAVFIGVSLGIVAAWRVGTWIDSFSLLVAMVGVSVPRFVLAPVLTLIFSLMLHWLPVAGWGRWENYILPSLVLSSSAAAILCRITRSSLLDVMAQDYIRTAHAKGLSESAVILVHGLKNAMIPVMTIAGTSFGFLLIGSFIVETIFNIPGLGRQGVEAIFQRDYPVIQGVVLSMVVVFALVNLIVDLLYALVDPRIKYD